MKRKYPLVGWKPRLLPTERAPWSSAEGLPAAATTETRLPSPAWAWAEPWLPDTSPTAADKEARPAPASQIRAKDCRAGNMR